MKKNTLLGSAGLGFILLFLNACSTNTIPPEEFAIVDLSQPINVVLRAYEDEEGNGSDDTYFMKDWLEEVAEEQHISAKFVFYEFPREPKSSRNPTLSIYLANWEYDYTRYKCTLLGKLSYDGKETEFSAIGKDTNIMSSTAGKDDGFRKCAMKAMKKIFNKFLDYTNHE